VTVTHSEISTHNLSALLCVVFPLLCSKPPGARVARIRQIDIRNFRGIASLSWDPSPGINCLIGPGDSGKSTVLDAIDLCLGARRNVQFSDSDFHQLDIENPSRSP
jgi:hypothetical protein